MAGFLYVAHSEGLIRNLAKPDAILNNLQAIIQILFLNKFWYPSQDIPHAGALVLRASAALSRLSNKGSHLTSKSTNKKASAREAFVLAHSEGFEPSTARFVAEYSIQLSYECIILVSYRGILEGAELSGICPAKSISETNFLLFQSL